METLVMVARTDLVLSGLRDATGLLTAAERQRAGRFRFDDDRADFIAAHLLVRTCAAQVVGRSPRELTLVQFCTMCGGPHGQPVLQETPQLAVSIAHTRGYVAAASGVGPLGVDLERTDDSRSKVPIEGVLTDAESRWALRSAPGQTAFLNLWVRKEALVKAGHGTLGTLASIELVNADGLLVDGSHGLRLIAFHDVDRVVAGACASRNPARIEFTV